MTSPNRLHELAAALAGTVASTHSITLRRNGVVVTYTFADRGAGSSHEAWTEVSAPFSAHYPLRMTIERGRVKPGEARIDIELGTPLFDEFFVVEAAPSDVVRALVDEEARRFLLAQPRRIELRAFASTIQLATPGWIEDAAKASELADHVAGLASRVRDAYAAADGEPIVETGDPYRPQQVSADDAKQARREQELDQLRRVARLRYDEYRRRGNRLVLAIFAVVGGAILLGVLLAR